MDGAAMAQEIAHLRDSLNQVSEHNQRTATAHDTFKTAMEFEVQHLRLQLTQARIDNAPKIKEFDLIDLKTMKPPSYGGDRSESYKSFNKKFKAFANGRRDGF